MGSYYPGWIEHGNILHITKFPHNGKHLLPWLHSVLSSLWNKPRFLSPEDLFSAGYICTESLWHLTFPLETWGRWQAVLISPYNRFYSLKKEGKLVWTPRVESMLLIHLLNENSSEEPRQLVNLLLLLMLFLLMWSTCWEKCSSRQRDGISPSAVPKLLKCFEGRASIYLFFNFPSLFQFSLWILAL